MGVFAEQELRVRSRELGVGIGSWEHGTPVKLRPHNVGIPSPPERGRARLTRHPWYMVYTGCGNRNCGLADTEGSTALWRAAYATDVEAMRLLIAYGADPNIPTKAPPPRRRRGGTFGREARPDPSELRPMPLGGPGLWPATRADADADPSGLPPYEEGGPGVWLIHAAAGVGIR